MAQTIRVQRGDCKALVCNMVFHKKKQKNFSASASNLPQHIFTRQLNEKLVDCTSHVDIVAAITTRVRHGNKFGHNITLRYTGTSKVIYYR